MRNSTVLLALPFILTFLQTVPCALAQTAVMYNSVVLSIDGTPNADSIMVSVDEGLDRVSVDLNDDGIFQKSEIFSGVRRIVISLNEAADDCLIFGPSSNRNFSSYLYITVNTGDGHDFVEVVGEFSDSVDIRVSGAGAPNDSNIALVSCSAGRVTYSGLGLDNLFIVDSQIDTVDIEDWGRLSAYIANTQCDRIEASQYSAGRLHLEMDRVTMDPASNVWVTTSPWGEQIDLSVADCNLGALNFTCNETSNVTIDDSSLERLSIETLAGNDTIQITNRCFFGDTVMIETGSGNDSISIENKSSFRNGLSIETGNDVDEVLFNHGSFHRPVFVSNYLAIDTGPRDDVVDIDSVNVNGITTINTDGGQDTVQWNDSTCVGEFGVQLGSDNDSLGISGSSFGAKFHATGGTEFDTVSLRNTQFTSKPFWDSFEKGKH